MLNIKREDRAFITESDTLPRGRVRRPRNTQAGIPRPLAVLNGFSSSNWTPGSPRGGLASSQLSLEPAPGGFVPVVLPGRAFFFVAARRTKRDEERVIGAWLRTMKILWLSWMRDGIFVVQNQGFLVSWIFDSTISNAMFQANLRAARTKHRV